MATDTAVMTPRRDSVVNDVSSPEEAAQIARQFRSVLQTLSSEHGYRSLVELVDRIPKLEADIREKEKLFRLAGEDWNRERLSHTAALENQLGLYKKEFAQFRKEEADFEQRIAKLGESLSHKDKTIAEFEEREASLKIIGRKLKEKYDAMKTKSEEKDGEISQLKQQDQEKQVKVDTLTATLKDVRSGTSALKSSLQKTQQDNVQLGKDLHVVKARLEEMNGYSAPLENTDLDTLAQEFNHIWVSVTLLVRKFVGDDLPESLLKRNWDTLNGAVHYIVDKPLPQSNSVIAKELRVVKVLAILADAIDTYLLQPTYQPPGESVTLQEILYELASAEPDRERVLRGMLLAALQGQRHLAEDELADRIVEDVTKTCGVQDVVRPDCYDDFIKTLEDVLGDVQDIWRKVQHSTLVLRTDFEGTPTADFKWADLEAQPSDFAQSGTHQDNNDVVALFPMLSLVGSETRPITSSTVVRKSQINALMREERRHTRSAEPGPSRPRPRPRTMSMSSNARSGQGREAFLPQTARSNEPSNV